MINNVIIMINLPPSFAICYIIRKNYIIDLNYKIMKVGKRSKTTLSCIIITKVKGKVKKGRNFSQPSEPQAIKLQE